MLLLRTMARGMGRTGRGSLGGKAVLILGVRRADVEEGDGVMGRGSLAGVILFPGVRLGDAEEGDVVLDSLLVWLRACRIVDDVGVGGCDIRLVAEVDVDSGSPKAVPRSALLSIPGRLIDADLLA